MTEQDNTAPAVWDPTARGGAGGWVRRKPSPQQPPTQQPPTYPGPTQQAPPYPGATQHPAYPPSAPQAPPTPQAPWPPTAPGSAPGAIGDQGPLLGARPYLPPPPPTTPAPPSGYGFPPGPPGAPAPPPAGFPGRATGFPPGYPAGQAPYPTAPAVGGNPQPGFPASPDYGRYEEVAPFPDEASRNRRPLYVALGVLLVVVLGVGVVWAVQSTGGGTVDQAKPAPAASTPQAAPTQPGTTAAGTAPTDAATASPSASSSSGAGANAAAEAKSLDDLLARDENNTGQIGNAVAKVGSCPGKSEVDSAAVILQNGALQRDQLIAELAKLNLTDLPGGTDAAQLLRSAWQLSGEIDRAYAAWARTVSSQGCSNGNAPSTADLQRANDLNPQARKAKEDFVAKWNSLAGNFNLTARTWDRI